MKNKNQKDYFIILSFLVILFVIAFIFYYQYRSNKKITTLYDDLHEKQESLSKNIADIETVLVAAQADNLTFAEALIKAEEEAKKLKREFRVVNENVSDLEKIATTDKELLQKYSKVYFLNEHYVPTDLQTITSKWTYNEDRDYKIHGKVWPFLERLLREAEKDGLDLQIISSYRSFNEQFQLKEFYTVQYGIGANTFSADQGYSEHQLGTAVDFTTNQIAATFSGFSRTEEYEWLQKNAHKYGFTLSYPEDNQYYQFEPWHWRFVGVKLARDLKDDNKFFYNLNQREIDKYIISLFD